MIKISNGFSLIELLMVLSIIIGIMIFIVPSQKLFLTRGQDQVLRSQLLHAILLTRDEAIAKSEIMTLCASQDSKQCSGTWSQGYIIYSSQKVIAVFHNNEFDQGRIHWRAFPNDRNDLQFLSSGLPNSENGTFWYCAKDAKNPSWAIAVSQSGRARLMMPNEAGVIEDISVSCE